MTEYETLSVRQDGHVLVIALDRPAKRNAFDLTMLRELAMVYGAFDADPSLRAAVVYGEGKMLTAGLDLVNVGPELQKGTPLVPDGGIHPWQVEGRRLSKPVVVAVHGTCLTLGIELILAADIAVADETANFSQLEIARGIYPFFGATLRFSQRTGWGNAMRWLLTAETFDAREALRIGLVQEVVASGEHRARAIEIAQTIARQAPLGVQATLESARMALIDSEAAEAELAPRARQLFASEDSRRGMESFVTRTPAEYVGR